MAPFYDDRRTPATPDPRADSARTYSIGVLVRRFNISAESLRNWERAGLIPPAHRTPGGHRRFGREHVDAVHKLLYAPGALATEDLDNDAGNDDGAFDDAGLTSPQYAA